MLRHEESTGAMRDAMGLLAAHLHAVSGQAVKVHKLTGFWKLDRQGRPNLLYCTDMHSVKANSDGEHAIKMAVRLKEGDLGIRCAGRSDALAVIKDGYKLRQLTYELGHGTSTAEALMKSIGVDAYRHFARRPVKSTENMRAKTETHCGSCRSVFPKSQLYPTKLKYLIAKHTHTRESPTAALKVIREVRALSMFVEEHFNLQPSVNMAPIVKDLYPKMKAQEYLEETNNPQFMDKEILVCSECFESLTQYMGKPAGVRSNSLNTHTRLRERSAKKNRFVQRLETVPPAESSDASSMYILDKPRQTVDEVPLHLMGLQGGYSEHDSQHHTGKKRLFFQKLVKPRREEKPERSEPLATFKMEPSASFCTEMSVPGRTFRTRTYLKPGAESGSKSQTNDVEYSISESAHNRPDFCNLVQVPRRNFPRVDQTERARVVEHRQDPRSASAGKSGRTQTATRATTAHQVRQSDMPALYRPTPAAKASTSGVRSLSAAAVRRPQLAVQSTHDRPDAGRPGDRRTQSAARCRPTAYIPRTYLGLAHRRSVVDELELSVRKPHL